MGKPPIPQREAVAAAKTASGYVATCDIGALSPKCTVSLEDNNTVRQHVCCWQEYENLPFIAAELLKQHSNVNLLVHCRLRKNPVLYQIRLPETPWNFSSGALFNHCPNPTSIASRGNSLLDQSSGSPNPVSCL